MGKNKYMQMEILDEDIQRRVNNLEKRMTRVQKEMQVLKAWNEIRSQIEVQKIKSPIINCKFQQMDMLGAF